MLPQLSALYFRSEEAEYPGPHRMVKGGYSQVALKIGENAPIRYEQPVTSIRWEQKSGKVATLTLALTTLTIDHSDYPRW